MGEENDEMMNIKEVARLQEWLLANGHTAEEVAECIRYIAQRPELKEKDSESSGKN